NMNYGIVSSIAVDPIEKKPLYHFLPGTLCFSLGTLGCNFHCQHCQNWEISCSTPSEVGRGTQRVPPELAIQLAKQHHCAGITWTYNEPTIWFEYTYDSAKLARANNLYTGYVTNGYITPEALDTIGPYLDAFRVDIKGFTDNFYRILTGIPHHRGILEVTQRAQEKWGMHVEIITNIIPTMNDDDEQLLGIATWIKNKLGELTPWHITRFYPIYKLTHLPPTPVSTLEHAWEIGKKAGLRFVYLGNVTGHQAENTTCYSCGKTIIERIGYQIKIMGLDDSRCRSCGANLNFKTAATKSS
ncbi:MAG: AmmeMemoRadiSam system radical SAM enzyme, partial [Dehalococcoidia bacterium]|nr:AmmeMemoRadiSam system radical SAM enzyme [Dehalococcoidia bacterium]